METSIVDSLIMRDYYQDKFQATLDEVKKVESNYAEARHMLVKRGAQSTGVVSMYINGEFRDVFVRRVVGGFVTNHGEPLGEYKL